MGVTDDAYELGLATAHELPRLQQIEVAAAARFRSTPLAQAAEAAGLSGEQLRSFLADDGLFVVRAAGLAVGFAACCTVDGHGHLAELDVLPEHAGRRLGARLIARVVAWSRARQLSTLTLVTFRHVPWNAPYYARLGFRENSALALAPGHRALWRAQAALGLDMQQRLFMARAVT